MIDELVLWIKARLSRRGVLAIEAVQSSKLQKEWLHFGCVLDTARYCTLGTKVYELFTMSNSSSHLVAESRMLQSKL